MGEKDGSYSNVRVTAKEFFSKFPRETTHEFMRSVLKRYPDAEGLVLYENQTFDSSEFGEVSALVVGPSNTVRSVRMAFEGNKPIGDVPSRFKYPVAWCPRDELLKGG